MSEPVKLILCFISDDVSSRNSVGAGMTEKEALEDAMCFFPDKSRAYVRKHLSRMAIHYRNYGIWEREHD